MSASVAAVDRLRHVTALLEVGRLPSDVSDSAIDSIVDAGLAGYASNELADDPRIRRGRMLLTARHVALRRAAVELLGAWSQAGIEALLFKGFYLAEFVYPDPSIRLYSDIDLALRAVDGSGEVALAQRAAEIAAQHGWIVAWRLGEAASLDGHHDDAYQGHELLQLKHEATGASLDAHRRLVHRNSNLSRRRYAGDAITAAVWGEAQAAELGSVPVWLPHPLDAALVGLIAARSWSGDRYRLRPHDLLDLDILMAHGRFGLDALAARAKRLGLSATTRLFLRRCDPVRRRIDLNEPSPLAVFAYDTLLLPERGHRGLERLWARLEKLPPELAAVLAALPEATWLRLRPRSQHRAPASSALSGVLSIPEHDKPLERRTWRRMQRGVRRSLKLLASPPERDPSLALACLVAVARRRGYRLERLSGEEYDELRYRGESLPLEELGIAGAGRAGPPSRWARLREAGVTGLILRLESLWRLRRVVRALEQKPFKQLHDELVAGREDASLKRTANGEVLLGIGTAVESAGRLVPTARCVARSLVAQQMLRQRGVPSVIHFGFKRSADGGVEGHAWLEAEGVVVTGDVGLDDFTRTATFNG